MDNLSSALRPPYGDPFVLSPEAIPVRSRDTGKDLAQVCVE